jgi:predicted nucleic acid-binding protein
VHAIAEPIVLDTDVVSRLLRGTLSEAIAGRLIGTTVIVTFVTVGELFRGATHARWGTRRVNTLKGWLAEVPVISADARVARAWGRLTGRALGSGQPLPANDAWIASCCIVHGLALATYNVRDYASIEGLRLVTAETEGGDRG